MNKNIHLWLALANIKNLKTIHALQLLNFFQNDIVKLFKASYEELNGFGVPEKVITAILHPDWAVGESTINRVNSNSNFHLLCLTDPHYPQFLKEIADPPLLLFINGNPEVLQQNQIGIVGSRHPSYYGLENACFFAEQLASAGLVITSGFAIGVDAAAHRGAIKARAKTIAVLGTGIDVAYPSSNQDLVIKIIETGGALISEFPFATFPKPINFPYRNRIISGLSKGVIIIEAAKKSGSLITARLANEQGRLVFVIPGAINNPLSHGCNALIRDGAIIIQRPDDVLAEFGVVSTALSFTTSLNQKPNLSFELNKFLSYIDYSETSIDLLVARSGLAVEKIFQHLLFLESKGHIKPVGMGYIKIYGENDYK